MTVSSQQNRIVVLADGATYAYEFPFIGVDADDIYVTYTDASGVSTQLSSNQFSVTLNAALPGELWGEGGEVTYPLVGSAAPNGAYLTIVRTLPETQETSLTNQTAFYPTVIERALDLLMMTLQQVSDQSDRALVQPVSDIDRILPLPGAAERANQLLGFDGDSNPIAAQPSSALVSTAMQPVVSAATLPLARAAMGVNYPTVVVSTNQTPGLNQYGTQYKATAAVTIALPEASDMFNGYSLSLQALIGNSNFDPVAGDTIYGLSAGVAQTVGVGSTGNIVTDGVSTWYYTESVSSAIIGEIKDFGGFAAAVPAKFLGCDGSAFLRASFPALLTAITMSVTAGRTFSGTTLTGFTTAQTDQLAAGMPIEGTGIQAATTIATVGATSITISATATSTGTGTVTIFPWGAGNGTTTANLPDLRGRTTAGPDKYSGGSAASRLTSTYFGSAACIGKGGGGQSQTLLQVNLPTVTLTTTIGAGQGSHIHPLQEATSVLTNVGGSTWAGGAVGGIRTITVDAATLPAMSGTTPTGGTDTPFSRVMPAAIVNKIIRALP